MALPRLPQIDRLVLATVTTVPEWHPQHATFEPFPVHAWLIRHPGGAILVDTGVGLGNELIDEWYHPNATPLLDALGGVGVAPSDIVAVVLSHLHFDHCGQQAALAAPVYVQATEFEVAQTPGYTVPGWAAIPNDRLRLVHGDQEIADGVRLLSTPGHSPGHQSVLVEAGGERVVIAAQCAFGSAELRTGEPVASNLHDEASAVAARDSLQRLRALAPFTAHLSHDPEIVAIVKWPSPGSKDRTGAGVTSPSALCLRSERVLFRRRVLATKRGTFRRRHRRGRTVLVHLARR